MNEQFDIQRAASAFFDSISYASDVELLKLCETLAPIIEMDAEGMFDALSEMDDGSIFEMCETIVVRQVAISAMEATG